MSISDLALASFTSTSTIVRLCKKAGTRGFSDFKYTYISEYPQMLQINESKIDIPFGKETNIDEIIHRLPAIYNKTLDLTKSNIDRSSMIRCINLIQRAQHVGIYGTGANFSLALTYQYKFQEIGINAIAYSSPLWTHLSHLKTHNIPSVGIILSATGENPLMIDVARRLKSLNIPTISICGFSNRTLNQYVTENIRIVSRLSKLDYHNLSTSISTYYVMDVLLSALFVKHYDENLNAHVQSDITAEDLQNDKVG
jgi:DNA-binding MurR/RpiR family transcriptional regulator